MTEAIKFTWIAWYVLGIAVGAFLWESQALGLMLAAIAAFAYFMARYVERRWTWEQFEEEGPVA